MALTIRPIVLSAGLSLLTYVVSSVVQWIQRSLIYYNAINMETSYGSELFGYRLGFNFSSASVQSPSIIVRMNLVIEDILENYKLY